MDASPTQDILHPSTYDRLNRQCNTYLAMKRANTAMPRQITNATNHCDIHYYTNRNVPNQYRIPYHQLLRQLHLLPCWSRTTASVLWSGVPPQKPKAANQLVKSAYWTPSTGLPMSPTTMPKHAPSICTVKTLI